MAKARHQILYTGSPYDALALILQTVLRVGLVTVTWR